MSPRYLPLLLASALPAATLCAPLPSLTSCGGFLVDPSTQRVVDKCGRERFFRGANKVEKSPPYYPEPLVFEAGNSATRGDAALQQSLGFNAMRLGCMWAGAAPTRGGGINGSYLSVLAGISATFSDEFGIATLVDAHQDTLSERFCDDGAPIWLAEDMAAGAPQPFPLPASSTPCAFGPDGRPTGDCCSSVSGWADFYLTSAVSFGFQQLYTNATFVDAFAEFFAAVARAYAPLGGDALLGMELLNEPWAGDVLADPLLLVPGVADRANLQPFYERVAAAIRAELPARGILYYEGVTWDDVFPLGFSQLPGAAAGLAGISHHYYDLPGLDFALDIAQRVADMRRLNATGMLTEFAMYADGLCPDSLRCMRGVLDTLEAHAHSYIGWEYATLWNGSAVLEPPVYEMVRPFPMAVAGRVRAVAFDRNASALTLTFAAPPGAPPAADAAKTVVFYSLGLYFPGGVQARVAAKPADAVVQLELPCWAGAGAGGAHVDPPGMNCAPAGEPPTPGAPPPYAYGYVELVVTTATGGDVTLVITGV